MTRTIKQIAIEIACSGDKIPNAAKPYLDAMGDLELMTDHYALDSGSGIVARFLCNAGQWKGETARRIKIELNAMLKEHYAKPKAPKGWDQVVA